MGNRNRPKLHAAIHQRLRYGNSRHHRRNEGHAACQRGRIVFRSEQKHRVRCRFGFRQSGHIAYSRTKSGLIRSRHSRNLFEKPLGRRRTDCLFRYRSCLDSGFADRLQGTNGRKRPHHIEKRSPGRRMGRRAPQNMHGYFAG